MRLVPFALLLASALPTAATQSQPFRTSVAAVRVDALVTSGNRPVPQLTAANFELRDNGVVQKITDIHHETLPLNIVCVLDLSGSVAGAPLVQLKQGLTAVIETLAPGDRAALLTFANRLQLHTPLTADRARLRSAVDEVKVGGSTSVFDAVFAGLALREADEGRTLLLLFTDGRDTSSWLSARKLIEAARRTDVVIYPVTLRSIRTALVLETSRAVQAKQPPPDAAVRVLEDLADETGGRIVYATGESALRTTFLAVMEEFRQRYVLSYEPSGVSGTGWHQIEVRLRGRSGEVRARRGYFVR
jgi:VWFA-related protein